MKNSNISIKDLRQLKMDSRYLFCIFLVLILAMEVFVVRTAIGIVFQLEGQAVPITPGGGVRVNFTDYNNDIKRIQNTQNFKPTGGISQNPFDANRPIPSRGSASSTPATFNDSGGVLQVP